MFLKTLVNISIFLFQLSLYFHQSIGIKAEGDLELIHIRRVEGIVNSYYNANLSNQYRNELTPEGNWTDVDYTSGCPARRANWPAQDHFHRILTLVSSFYRNQTDTDLLNKASLALDHWFSQDFQSDDCINAGGNANLGCPCGTPGFWNTNWYCQMILIPGLVGSTCLVLKPHLTPTQYSNCSAQTLRSYVRINGDSNGSMGPMTGANLLDVSSIGMSLALLTNDEALLEEAIAKIYQECEITQDQLSDGIKIDGSYMQHSSQIYTGNYGKVFMNNMIKIFRETSGTDFIPPTQTQEGFLTLIKGSEWFIYLKKGDQQINPILSWQYSVIGRMVSHKFEDWRGIDLNFNHILEATQSWENHADFNEIISRLNSSDVNVNPGNFVGTKFFHVADYLVHRGQNFEVSLKMYSSRTTNSECNNGQNPYGFHLSDGNIYTYLSGNEYTNVYGAWNWFRIPGTTSDEATPLACGRVQFKQRENFVGGLAFGNSGLAVMNYTNPSTGNLRWLKTFFFFPNSYIVQSVGGIRSVDGSQVYTTLDQRQRSGPVYINGQLMQGNMTTVTAQTIWHDRVLYQMSDPVLMTVDVREKQSNWSAIGISEGNEMQNLFAAYFENQPALDFSYVAHLDVDFSKNQPMSSQTTVSILDSRNGKQSAIVRGAVYNSVEERIVSIAFLTNGQYSPMQPDIVSVWTDTPVLLMFSKKMNQPWQLGVADPTQSVQVVNISVTFSSVTLPIDLTIELPNGAWAGSTKVMEIPGVDK